MGKGSSETTTTAISQEDANSVRAGRTAGQATANAANAGPWAQGVNQLTQQALGQYGDMYNQYGQMGGQGQNLFNQASQVGMQTGLEGLGGYMNPMLEQYFAGMDPMYQRAMEQANMMAKQGASGAGMAFGQNSRAGLMQGQAIGDIMRQQMADYGNRQYQSASDAANMLMADRNRIGSYQGMYGQMGLAGLGGQMDVTKNQMLGGDYLRNVASQQAQDPYMRRAAAQQAIQSGHGQNISTSTTTEKSGDLLGDILSVGSTIGSFAVPGAGGLLGGLLGGGGGAPQITSQMAQATQPQNVMGPTVQPLDFAAWNNPWGD